MQQYNKYTFSEEFIKKVIESAGGFLSSGEFENLIDIFEKEASVHHFTGNSESNLLRIIESRFDKNLFLRDCLKFPHHSEIIITLAANSNYLTDIAVRNPENLNSVFDQTFLNQELNMEILEEAADFSMQNLATFDAKLNFLRIFKRRILLKIGLSDILGLYDLFDVTAQVSNLATVLLKIVFKLCFEKVCNKYGIEPDHTKYTLCSLGKHGGNELNYSSDVDLILFFDSNTKIQNKEYFELLSEATKLFIQSCTEITDKGYLYRVDFRLRPDGKHAPLARTLTDMLRYYETRGEDWERQMLLKLGFVCGNPELFNSFKDFLKSYIFPKTFKISPLEQIKKMKNNIESRLGEKENIKLFSGGIRDIEFSVQALQMISGGKTEKLRSGNSLIALEGLLEAGMIDNYEYTTFRESYIVYRKIEHFLQLMNDTQTHEIPASGETPHKLARFLKFKNLEIFREDLSKKRTAVRKIYNSITGSDEEQIEKDDLSTVKFKDIKKAKNNYNYLKTGKGLFDQKEFDSITIEKFRTIEEDIEAYLKKCLNPDLILENLVRTIRSATFKSMIYAEFQNKKFLNDYLKICEFSQRTVDLISSNKKYYEVLLSGKVFIKDLEDLYGSIELNELKFILSFQYALNLMDYEELTYHISSYCAFRINGILKENRAGYNYFLAGMGSFGSGEMTFESDIDLIVIAENVTDVPEIHNFFKDFLNEAKDILKYHEVDFRLRPEGKNSPLVTDYENFRNYLSTRARIWEFQAFTKMKFISGNINLYNSAVDIIAGKLNSFEIKDIIKENKEMYSRMKKQTSTGMGFQYDVKKSGGSILDIDFLLQFISLQNKDYFYETIGRNITSRIINLINLHPENEKIKELPKLYTLLKSTEIAMQNIFNKRGTAIPNKQEDKEMLFAFMAQSGFPDYEKSLSAAALKIKTIYKEFIA